MSEVPSGDGPTVILDLPGEADIPTNGTLSRVLYSDERVRLVLFAFDEGQELTDHAAGSPAVVQVVSGRFRLTLGGEVVEADARAWVHMPAGLAHSVLALEAGHLLLTLLRGG